MTQLSIRVTGGEIVRKGLQDLSAEIPKIGRQGLYNAALAVTRREKDYWFGTRFPPELPSYTRTGTLARGWQIIPTSNGYRIQNDTPYTQYVVGNAYGLGQAWMHQPIARWGSLLFRDVVDEETIRLGPEIENAITLVARRDGF